MSVCPHMGKKTFYSLNNHEKTQEQSAMQVLINVHERRMDVPRQQQSCEHNVLHKYDSKSHVQRRRVATKSSKKSSHAHHHQRLIGKIETSLSAQPTTPTTE